MHARGNAPFQTFESRFQAFHEHYVWSLENVVFEL